VVVGPMLGPPGDTVGPTVEGIIGEGAVVI